MAGVTADLAGSGLLDRLERYYDSVPRPAARAEPIGPLVLFVRSGAGWPYYARPRPGAAGDITAADVLAVRERQRELGIPEAFEWVEETTPSLHAAAEAAGLRVRTHPLLVLDRTRWRPAPPPEGVEVRRITADAADLAAVHSVPSVAFGSTGTDRGRAGTGERDLAAIGQRPEALEALRDRLRTGRTVMYAAYGPQGALSVGSHQPVDGTTEVVGVGTLPAFRRAGLGTAVTSALVAHALGEGASLVFLSADTDAVARVYARVGFSRAGTAAIGIV